jgi:hypothetical protein
MAEHHNSSGHSRPFAFLPRSPGVSSQTDEDGLLHARRQHSQKSARLLELKRENHDKQPLAGSSVPAPVSSSSFVDDDAELGPGNTFQYSESRPSHAADTTVPVPQVLHKQPFFVARSSQSPITYRKTLHERLHRGDQAQKPRFADDASGFSNPLRSYQSLPALLPEPMTVFPNYVNKITPSPRPVPDAEPNESLASMSNFKNEDSEIKARSRSSSMVSSSVDTRGMQGVVMEAMKSIQRYESENEIQVNRDRCLLGPLIKLIRSSFQKSEIERLNTRNAFLEKEKDHLAAKVQLIKDTSLKKLAISSQRYIGI